MPLPFLFPAWLPAVAGIAGGAALGWLLHAGYHSGELTKAEQRISHEKAVAAQAEADRKEVQIALRVALEERNTCREHNRQFQVQLDRIRDDRDRRVAAVEQYRQQLAQGLERRSQLRKEISVHVPRADVRQCEAIEDLVERYHAGAVQRLRESAPERTAPGRADPAVRGAQPGAATTESAVRARDALNLREGASRDDGP